MRTSHFLAFIFIICSCSQALAFGGGSADFEQSRAANIAAFNTYLEGKERANTQLENNQITYPGYLERRIEYLQRIDRRNLDSKLSEYFDVLKKQFIEQLPIGKEFQKAYDKISEGVNATGDMLGYSAGGYGGLGYIVAKGMNDQIVSGAEQYLAQYKTRLNQIENQYDRRLNDLLGRLTTEYDYPFLSIIDGG